MNFPSGGKVCRNIQPTGTNVTMNPSLRVLSLKFLTAVILACSVALTAAAPKPKKILVVTTTTGFRHSSIETAERILQKLGRDSGAFTVDYARVTPPQAPNKPNPPKDTGDADKLKAETEKFNAAMETFKAADARYQEQLKAYAAEQKRILADKMSASALKNY